MRQPRGNVPYSPLQSQSQQIPIGWLLCGLLVTVALVTPAIVLPLTLLNRAGTTTTTTTITTTVPPTTTTAPPTTTTAPPTTTTEPPTTAPPFVADFNITCPDDYIEPCGNPLGTAISAGLGCNENPANVTFTDLPGTNTTIIREWTAFDICNNTETCEQEVNSTCVP